MKLAIISGASRGLGMALSCELEKSGHYVLGLGRTQMKSFPGLYLGLDLFNLEKIESALDEKWNEIDTSGLTEIYLINNAALLGPIDCLERCNTEEINQHMTVNITAPMVLNKWLINKVKGLGIRSVSVGVSSGAAVNAYAGWTSYCTSKAALRMLTQTIAREQESLDPLFEIWDYNPGVMDTEMQSLIRSRDEASFPGIQKFIDLYKEGGLKSTEAVAIHLRKLLSTSQKSGSTLSFS